MARKGFGIAVRKSSDKWYPEKSCSGISRRPKMRSISAFWEADSAKMRMYVVLLSCDFGSAWGVPTLFSLSSSFGWGGGGVFSLTFGTRGLRVFYLYRILRVFFSSVFQIISISGLSRIRSH